MDLICRTCLAYNDELEPLYAKKLVDTDYEDITTMIFLCTGLEISKGDQLSDTICTQCIDSIIAAFKYRKKVWKSNNVLLEASKMFPGATEKATESDENNKIWLVAPFESKTEPKLENFDIELSNLETLEAEFLNFEPPSYEDEITNDSQSDLKSNFSETTSEQSFIDLGRDDINLSLERGIEKPDYQKNNVLLEASKKFPGPTEKATESDGNNKIWLVAPFQSKAESKLENFDIELSNLETLQAEFLNFEPPSYEDEITNDSQSDLKSIFSETTGEQTYIDLGPDDINLSLKQLGIEKPDHQKIFKDLDKYIQKADQSTTLRPYCCTECNQTYEVAGPLYRHLVANHNIRLRTVFRCKACLKTYMTENSLRSHLKKIHLSVGYKFTCHFCGQPFKYKCVLEEHLNRHNGIKPYQCDICQYRTTNKSALKLHLRAHTKERPFVCNICNMGFRSSSHRAAHIKEAHSDKPHECKICGTEFTSWRVYQRHMPLHNPKNMNLKCDICHKNFIRKRYLKLHMRHHGEKMFKCAVCEKAFHQKQNCKNHMKKTHNYIQN